MSRATNKYLAVPLADIRAAALVMGRRLRRLEGVAVVQRNAVEVCLIGYRGRKPDAAAGWPTVNYADALALVVADGPTSGDDAIATDRWAARRQRLITEARRESD